MGPNFKKERKDPRTTEIGPILKIGLKGSTDGRFGPNFKKGMHWSTDGREIEIEIDDRIDLQGHLSSFKVILSKLTFLNYHSLFFVVQPIRSSMDPCFPIMNSDWLRSSYGMTHTTNEIEIDFSVEMELLWNNHSSQFSRLPFWSPYIIICIKIMKL